MVSRFGVTADGVRFLVGVGTSELSDSDINTQIENAEYEVEQVLKTKFGAMDKSEYFTSRDGSNIHMLVNTPVNRILEVWVGTGITPKFVKFDRDSGKMVLTNSGQATNFNSEDYLNNFVRYEYGRLDETTSNTTMVNNQPSGTTVQLEVGTTMGAAADNYVMIVGAGTEEGDTVGQKEIAKVTISSGTGITVDSTQYDHSSGDKVILMGVPQQAKRLAEVLAGIRGALNMVGSTYTFATSYSIPEKSVTKGVPYPHFEKVLNRLTQMRDDLIGTFVPEFGIA